MANCAIELRRIRCPAVLARSLERLVDAARALPGARHAVLPLSMSIPATGQEIAGADVDISTLRGRLGHFLGELSQRLEPALTAALQHAAVAWDSFDEVSVLNPQLLSDAAEIAAAAATLERQDDKVLRAFGMEIRIALHAALGLIDLVERRLATLVRLRVQSGDSSLLPGGRPFLDIAAALAEAARGWARGGI